MGGEKIAVISEFGHLADNVPVRKADDHPVLGCVVLVLILNDQALTSKEVSLSLWKERTTPITSNENQNNLNMGGGDGVRHRVSYLSSS